MWKRLPVVLAFLVVCGAVSRLQSTGRAEGPEDVPAAVKEARAEAAQSLLLAIDSLQTTLSDQGTLIAHMEAELKREQAQVSMTEERLKKAEAQRLEIEKRMKALRS